MHPLMSHNPEKRVLTPCWDWWSRFFFVSQYSDQVVPILGLVGLRSLIGLADRLLRRFGKDKKDPMQVRWLHAPCRAVCMESFHVVEEIKKTSAA